MGSKEFETVAVIGLGYTGLPTAALLASAGIKVIGVDTDETRVKEVNAAELSFQEPQLQDLIEKARGMGLLEARTTPMEADAFILAVPTPLDSNNKVDLSHVCAAAKSIAPALKGGELVVLESTAPPGTTEKVAELLSTLRPDLTHFTDETTAIHCVHAPERVIPGDVVNEMKNNSRVIGASTTTAACFAEQLYKQLTQAEIYITDPTTAELVKLAENTYRDINIAFANELADVSTSVGANPWDVIDLANHHPRVNIHTPGPGVEGHCIPIDPWFLTAAAPSHVRLIPTARGINSERPSIIAEQALTHITSVEQPKVLIYGLAFKPDVDDIRMSPAVEITETIAQHCPNAEITVVEPHLAELPEVLQKYSNISLHKTISPEKPFTTVLHLVAHSIYKSNAFERYSAHPQAFLDFTGLTEYSTRSLHAAQPSATLTQKQ